MTFVVYAGNSIVARVSISVRQDENTDMGMTMCASVVAAFGSDRPACSLLTIITSTNCLRNCLQKWFKSIVYSGRGKGRLPLLFKGIEFARVG